MGASPWWGRAVLGWMPAGVSGSYTSTSALDLLGRHGPAAPTWHGLAEWSPMMNYDKGFFFSLSLVELVGTFQAVPFGMCFIYF